jgi:hypothetical protein
MASTKLLTIVCTAGLLLSGIGAAQAQSPDQMKMVYEAARNQLGVLEYCADKGMADSSAVDTQKKMLTLLPPPADTSGGDAAEKVGRTGKVAALGVEKTLDEAAKAQGSTTDAFCHRIADAVKSAGAQFK